MKKSLFISSVLFLFLAVFTVSSCTKDEEPTMESLLCSGKWYLEEALDDCKKDNYLEFKTDKTGVNNPGAILCDEDDKEEVLNWNISTKESKNYLTISDPTGVEETVDFEILELNSDRMILNYQIFTLKYKH